MTERNKKHMQEMSHQVDYYKEERQYRINHWAEIKIKDIGARAKKRGNRFLEMSDLDPLPKFCSVFGILLDYKSGPDRRLWASVDRIKPELGYVKGNVLNIYWPLICQNSRLGYTE